VGEQFGESRQIDEYGEVEESEKMVKFKMRYWVKVHGIMENILVFGGSLLAYHV